MLRRLTSYVLVLLVAFVVFPGCKTQPVDGNNCSTTFDKATCIDANTLMSCEDDQKWHKKACLGRFGCSMAQGVLSACDTTISIEGSPCDDLKNVPNTTLQLDKGAACNREKNAEMICKDGKWAIVQKCLGKLGCDLDHSTTPDCDTSFALEGDPCRGPSHACSVDKQSMLLCKDDHWKKIMSCGGPLGCVGTIPCDNPTAKAGDFCQYEPSKDNFVCSSDKKSMLKCESDGWKIVKNCLGPDGCYPYLRHVIRCDESVQEPGAPCEKYLLAACSTDGKTILECKQGSGDSQRRFIKTRTCPKACKVLHGLSVECE